MSHFQVMLHGQWSNYERAEDGILKRAYMSGHKTAKYSLRGNWYEYDFMRMKQMNIESAKERDIRPPHRMKPPSQPVVPSGPVITIKVPPRSPGTVIKVPHPRNKSQMIRVQVPKSARVGQTMIVPVPALKARTGGYVPTPASGRIPTPSAPPASSARIPTPSAPPASSAKPTASGSPSKKGRKDVVGVGLGGLGLVGGAAVAGALIGDAVGDGDLDGVIDAVDLGLDDAGDWLLDAGEDAGDFIMDLF